MTLVATLRRMATLGPDELAAWQDLAVAAGDAANPFLEPWFLHTALARFDPEGRARLLIASDNRGTWHGMMVVAPSLWLGRVPFAGYQGWHHANQFLGTPLLRDGHSDASWQAFLTALDTLPPLRAGLTLASVPSDDPTVAALRRVCASTGRPIRTVLARSRAMLADDGSTMLPPKRVARLSSQARRLESHYGWQFETLDRADDLERWTSEFLALESSGWKGEEGSALACDPRTEALFRTAVSQGLEAGRLRGHALRIDGRAIAMTTYLMRGRHAYGFKACYDECFASYAPGLLLLREVMATLPAPIAFDSCATAPNAALSDMWRGRREIVDLCVALGHKRRWLYRLALATTNLWARSKHKSPIR